MIIPTFSSTCATHYFKKSPCAQIRYGAGPGTRDGCITYVSDGTVLVTEEKSTGGGGDRMRRI